MAHRADLEGHLQGAKGRRVASCCHLNGQTHRAKWHAIDEIPKALRWRLKDEFGKWVSSFKPEEKPILGLKKQFSAMPLYSLCYIYKVVHYIIIYLSH